jgi:tetratricopeptide (TPR) repeat protein
MSYFGHGVPMERPSCPVLGGKIGASLLILLSPWFAIAQQSTPGVNAPGAGQDSSRTNVLDEHQTFITGRVQFDDGSPPNTDIKIERVCGSTVYLEGHPDSKGNFGVNLGGRSYASDSASASSKGAEGGMRGEALTSGMPGAKLMTERDIYGCELRAAYPGYRSDGINMTSRRSFDQPDVGTIILHRIAGIQGTTISFTSAQAPKEAKHAFDKGATQESKKDWKAAANSFHDAVKIYPQYAAAWFELGRLEQAQNRLDQARQFYERALQEDPKYTSPYERLALLAIQEGKWEEAARISQKGLDLNSVEFAGLWYYNAVSLYNLHKVDLAAQSADKAVNLDRFRKFPEAQLLLAGVLTEQRKYAAAVLHLRAYLEEVPGAPNAGELRKKLAALEPLVAAQN